MKVVIAGSRNIHDYALIVDTINKSGYDITEVVSGCAFGVDRVGERWARVNNIVINEMPAEWSKYDKAAGALRNKAMAEYADAAIIIWDGHSPGTRNMIENMIRRNKPYYIGMTSATLEDFI